MVGRPCVFLSELHVRRRPRKIPPNLCHRCIQGLGWCVGFSSIVEIPPPFPSLCLSRIPSFSLSFSLLPDKQPLRARSHPLLHGSPSLPLLSPPSHFLFSFLEWLLALSFCQMLILNF